MSGGRVKVKNGIYHNQAHFRFFFLGLSKKKAVSIRNGGYRLQDLGRNIPERNHMGTISLLASSFQVTMTYQSAMAKPINSRVYPYPMASGR